MHEWRQPLQPPVQPKLAPGDRLLLHAWGVRWDEPELIEAPKKEVVGRNPVSTEYPDYD